MQKIVIATLSQQIKGSAPGIKRPPIKILNDLSCEEKMIQNSRQLSSPQARHGELAGHVASVSEKSLLYHNVVLCTISFQTALTM